jgi:hypothetical protein
MKSNEGCSSLAGVIASALIRPHWGRSNQIRLQKMSLREWPLVFQSFTQMLQSHFANFPILSPCEDFAIYFSSVL